MAPLETVLRCCNSYPKGFLTKNWQRSLPSAPHPKILIARRRLSQAAHRSPLPTHPKASITPHPGGLLRKAGRSPSGRPFVFLAPILPQAEGGAGLTLAKNWGKANVRADLKAIVAEATQCQTPQKCLSRKKKRNKIEVKTSPDMHFCKLPRDEPVLKWRH